MAEKNALTAIERDNDRGRSHKEPSCIHTKKIYDACRDKDCIEDARVYLTRKGQAILDRAINVKCRGATCIWVFVDVEAVSFNRGFYTVDVKYFYRVTVDAFLGVSRPVEIEGLCTFDKRVILFGSEGNAKIFSSRASLGEADVQKMRQANMPTAVVEYADYLMTGRFPRAERSMSYISSMSPSSASGVAVIAPPFLTASQKFSISPR